jgi:hypothetical protein
MEGTTSRWPNVPLLIESIARDVSYAGRLLWKDLTATVVTVISLSLAIGACTASFSLIDALRRYLPGEHALGKRFSYVGRGNALVSQEIVGIVQDAKYASVRQAAPPTVYLPQLTPGWTAVQLRTKAEPAAVAALLRQELPRMNPSLRIVVATLQSTLVDNALVRERALALISGFFSVVAIVLVTVGLYGTLSYSVVVRTREIGIRLALGARPMRVAGLMLTEVGIVTTIGLAVGIAGGLAGSRYITTLLYQVLPTDVTSLGLPVMSILAAAAFSALVPALRALRVDPVETLRRE